MSMGRMNNGLLTQDYMDELLNVGGADRQQYGTLMSPIVNPINQRVLGGLTEGKRARGGAMEEYLSRYQQGINTLDEQAIPPISFEELNQDQKDALMRGESITLDDRRTTIGNIGGFSLTRPSRKYNIEDFGLELPPAGNVLARKGRLGELPEQDDMSPQSVETNQFGSDQFNYLDQEDADFGMVSEDGETTPSQSIGLDQFNYLDQEDADFGMVGEDVDVKEKKDKANSILSNLQGLFDNKQAFGKIALGVALLEGVPMTEAFEMYENFAGQGNPLEIEVYDKQTGQIVGHGSKDNQYLINLASDPRYRLQKFGTQATYEYDNEQMRLARFEDANEEQIKDIYVPILGQSNTQITDGQKLLRIINDENFKSGRWESASFESRQWLRSLGWTGDTTVPIQTQFQTIINRLIPNVRPAGAGATSNFEIELYEGALPSLKNDEDTNRLIIENLIRAAKIDQTRANYVINMTAERGDVSATQFAQEFSSVIDRIEDANAINQPVAVTEEEKKMISGIYNFITLDDLAKMTDADNLPSNTIILK